jgi:DNA-binding response OmpR family regulator
LSIYRLVDLPTCWFTDQTVRLTAIRFITLGYEQPMKSKRILIIDDEASMRELLPDCLRELAGWEVWSVGSDPDGLAQAITYHPDLILIEPFPRFMERLDILEQLRNCSATRRIPVVCLSRRPDLINQQVQAELAVMGVIAKPFDATTLVAQIAQICDWSPMPTFQTSS